MNREIEFRGKKLNKSEWVYGYYQKDEIGSYIIDINADEINEGIGYSVFENTIGQYTGLKDINGVKIYEGDIVNVVCKFQGKEEFNGTGIVKYDQPTCSFVIDCVNIEECMVLYENLKNDEREHTNIVLGNIYDNKLEVVED